MDSNTDARIGALSEIDRLGQAALDAIYAEEAGKHPRHEWIKNLLRKTPPSEQGSTELLDFIGNETGMDRQALVEYAMNDMRAGLERAQAVKSYITSRRIMDQLGAL